MSEQAKKQTIKEQLEKELATWQTKMDEAKVQMHLGLKETEDKIKPHVEKLDKELNEAKVKLEAFEQSSEGAWEEVKAGVESSIDVMKMAFESAEKHFTKDKK
jgi:hypothetical protein